MTTNTNLKAVVVYEDAKILDKFDRLERFGWTVAPLENKLGVSQTVLMEKADVIVIWLGEPNLPGIRLLKALKKKSDPKVPILLYSTIPLGQLLKIVKESGADGMVSQAGNPLNLNFEFRQNIGKKN